MDATNSECSECGTVGGHEVWCSLVPSEIPASLPESVWFAIGERGTRTRFTMAPGASEEKALQYAIRHLGAYDRVASVQKDVR